MTQISTSFFSRASLAALTVVAGLGAADMAQATDYERGRGGGSGTPDGQCENNPDCGGGNETPTGGDNTNTNDNSNTNTNNNDNTNHNSNSNSNDNTNHNSNTNNNANYNGNHNSNNNSATGGNAHAEGGQGGHSNSDANSNSNSNADANSHSNSDANSNSNSNATVGNTTATAGDSTSNSGAVATNSGQNVSVSSTYEEAAQAYAPTPMATGGNGVRCGQSVGVTGGFGKHELAVSGGLNLPVGVNETCMTFERATTITSAGIATYPFNYAGGADLVATGLAVMMQTDPTVDTAVKFVASQNCESGNALDRFRDGCGRRSTGTPALTYGK